MADDTRDGYVILYGGAVQSPNLPADACLNDTWTFSAGTWTNLSIAGMPSTCDPVLTFDAADGYIVALLSSNTIWGLNETWIFSGGEWTRLYLTLQPTKIFGATATYDPNLGAVLLFGSSFLENGTAVSVTWEFKGGAWHSLGTDYRPFDRDPNYDLTYDASEGRSLLLADGRPSWGYFGQPLAIWEFYSGEWNNTSLLPDQLRANVVGYISMVWAFDVKDGYTVLYAGIWNSSCVCDRNQSWIYEHGVWSEQIGVSPPGRLSPAMIFDSEDGYVLFFGGVSHGTPVNDTWIYSPPPVAMTLRIGATPQIVCSGQSLDCGAGTDEARVTIRVTVAPFNSSTITGNDVGNGTVTYGPYYWVALPQVEFVSWGSTVPSPDLRSSTSCFRGDGGPTTCQVVPDIVTVTGRDLLQWNWSQPSLGSSDSLRAGDSWSIAFSVQVEGPPFGVVPIDSCTTTLCDVKGSSSVSGHISALTFSPFDNASRLEGSLPLGELTVLPPLTQTGPTSSAAPPPPPGVGSPLPVGLPAPPNILPLPTPVAGPASISVVVSGNFSISAIAAGLLSAGLTRSALTQRAQRVRVASSLAARAQQHRKPKGRL